MTDNTATGQISQAFNQFKETREEKTRAKFSFTSKYAVYGGNFAHFLLVQVQKQCMEVKAIRPIQAVPPVSVTLYYESMCPSCRVFITQQLFPTWTMLQDIMAITLVPFGNTKIPSVNPVFACQHGQPECRGNMIEACVIHLTGNNLAFHIIYCMESSADVLSAAQPCLQLYAPSVSWSAVDSCVKGGLGYQLMEANAAMTRALNPTHKQVPWVTFNGEYTVAHEDKAMSSLFHLVCQLYKVRAVCYFFLDE
uniref:Gamma-interferon-inducible lysosomal thiol reductase n=1 Tax=Salarias fasciatus TaxID=181472 RepID=A0A672GAI3_SALFA